MTMRQRMSMRKRTMRTFERRLGTSIGALHNELALLRADVAALTDAVRALSPSPRRVRKRT